MRITRVFIPIALAILGISGLTIFKPFSLFEDSPATKIKEETAQPTFQPSSADKVRLARLTETLKDLSLRTERLRFIKENVESLPSRLSLRELNDLLSLFSLGSQKLEVTKIFKSRLDPNYSTSELERFRNHYSLNSQKRQAVGLILGN